MKLAWICYDNDPEYPEVKIVFIKPDDWRYSRVVPIVYAVVEQ